MSFEMLACVMVRGQDETLIKKLSHEAAFSIELAFRFLWMMYFSSILAQTSRGQLKLESIT